MVGQQLCEAPQCTPVPWLYSLAVGEPFRWSYARTYDTATYPKFRAGKNVPGESRQQHVLRGWHTHTPDADVLDKRCVDRYVL